MTLTHTDVALACQYLYYVIGNPIWTDFEYDTFCRRHGLIMPLGSDRHGDYCQMTAALAMAMLRNPKRPPTEVITRYEETDTIQ